MKLHKITKKQARHICKLLNEPFISMMVNDDGKWDDLGLEIQIETTSTLDGNKDESSICIYKDGKVSLHRNNGNPGGYRYIEINAMLITDYLREQGYEFGYKDVTNTEQAKKALSEGKAVIYKIGGRHYILIRPGDDKKAAARFWDKVEKSVSEGEYEWWDTISDSIASNPLELHDYLYTHYYLDKTPPKRLYLTGDETATG